MRYIRSRVMGAGPGRFVPAGERVLSGLTLRPGLHPSPHTQPIMSFMVSSRANAGPASLISSMFTLFLSLMVTLISHLTLPSTWPPWPPPPPHFLLRLPRPSICFSINCRLLISASFTLHIFSQSSPNGLFNCICPIPILFFFLSLHYYTDVCHSGEASSIPLSAFSPSGLSRGVLTGVVMGCCQRSPPLSASTSASLIVECPKGNQVSLWTFGMLFIYSTFSFEQLRSIALKHLRQLFKLKLPIFLSQLPL